MLLTSANRCTIRSECESAMSTGETSFSSWAKRSISAPAAALGSYAGAAAHPESSKLAPKVCILILTAYLRYRADHALPAGKRANSPDSGKQVCPPPPWISATPETIKYFGRLAGDSEFGAAAMALAHGPDRIASSREWPCPRAVAESTLPTLQGSNIGKLRRGIPPRRGGGEAGGAKHIHSHPQGMLFLKLDAEGGFLTGQ